VAWNLVALTQIASTLAVLISLLYVARQLRLRTVTARAAAYQWFVAQETSLANAILTDVRLTEVFDRAVAKRAPFETFSEIDRTTLMMLCVQQARIYETMHRQVNEGVLDESALNLVANMTFLTSPAWRGVWPRVSEALSPGFVAYFNARHGASTTTGS
jgi:hypothetical protein